MKFLGQILSVSTSSWLISPLQVFFHKFLGNLAIWREDWLKMSFINCCLGSVKRNFSFVKRLNIWSNDSVCYFNLETDLHCLNDHVVTMSLRWLVALLLWSFKGFESEYQCLSQRYHIHRVLIFVSCWLFCLVVGFFIFCLEW